MWRQMVAVVLMLTLTLSAQGVPKATPKEKVLAIPVGTVVEVKRVGKQALRGRLGEATDDGFAVQVVRQEKIETVQVPFSELKSIKVKQNPNSGGGVSTAVAWALVGAGAGALALLLGLLYGNR